MGELVTARLVLAPMDVAEAERVAVGTAGDDSRWAPGFPAPGEVAAAGNFLRICAAHGDPQPFGPYVIRRRDDGCAIGGVGFHGPPDEHGVVTIGYGLIPAERGKGYAAEALRRLLVLARELGVAKAVGDTTHDNIASQRVMSAAAMRLAAEDARLKHYQTDWPDA